jgi:hypothetical protein
VAVQVRLGQCVQQLFRHRQRRGRHEVRPPGGFYP